MIGLEALALLENITGLPVTCSNDLTGGVQYLDRANKKAKPPRLAARLYFTDVSGDALMLWLLFFCAI